MARAYMTKGKWYGPRSADVNNNHLQESGSIHHKPWHRYQWQNRRLAAWMGQRELDSTNMADLVNMSDDTNNLLVDEIWPWIGVSKTPEEYKELGDKLKHLFNMKSKKTFDAEMLKWSKPDNVKYPDPRSLAKSGSKKPELPPPDEPAPTLESGSLIMSNAADRTASPDVYAQKDDHQSPPAVPRMVHRASHGSVTSPSNANTEQLDFNTVRIEALERQLSHAQDERDVLRREKAGFTSTLHKQLDALKTEKDKTIVGLSNDLNTLEYKLDGKEQERKTIQAKLDNQVDAVRREKANDASALQQQLDDVSAKKDETIVDLRNHISTLEFDLSSKDGQVQSLESKLANEAANNEILRGQLREARDDKLNSVIHLTDTHAAELQKLTRESDEEIARLRKVVAAQKAEITRLIDDSSNDEVVVALTQASVELNDDEVLQDLRDVTAEFKDEETRRQNSTIDRLRRRQIETLERDGDHRSHGEGFDLRGYVRRDRDADTPGPSSTGKAADRAGDVGGGYDVEEEKEEKKEKEKKEKKKVAEKTTEAKKSDLSREDREFMVAMREMEKKGKKKQKEKKKKTKQEEKKEEEGEEEKKEPL